MNLLICGETQRRVGDEHRPGNTAPEHGGKRIRRTRLWRHPFKTHIEVPYRVAAAIAVMEMGISDYSVIADAVGLTVKEVESIDMVENPAVRQLVLARIPVDESFKLNHRVRCPKCQAKVCLAPCIACRGN